MIELENFTRINNDVNGNPRYVFHFLHLSKDYARAVKLANKHLGGRKYHTKTYGGGIVIQSYELRDDIKIINQRSEKCGQK